jgi:hypothetical protein
MKNQRMLLKVTVCGAQKTFSRRVWVHSRVVSLHGVHPWTGLARMNPMHGERNREIRKTYSWPGHLRSRC